MNNNDFDFLSGRIRAIDIGEDILKNFEFRHYLSEFEKYIYGVLLQLNRIHKALDLKNPKPGENKYSNTSASLDIYYYTLTWDKLKKIFEKIKRIINDTNLSTKAINTDFTSKYRLLRRRFENLFSEFDTDIRNEFEHPSLKAYVKDNIIMYGGIKMDSSGDVEAHAGGNYYAIIKQDHFKRINELRIELFDLLMHYFSNKPLNKELLTLKQYLIDNIDHLLDDLRKSKKGFEELSDSIKQFILVEISLSIEGIDLPEEIRGKIYSLPFNIDNS